MYVEDLQSQLRAENGIKERIIGYVGSDETFLDELPDELSGLPSSNVDQLPDDLQWMYKAEKHRMKTGEVLTVEQYRKQYPNG